jgi:hypothetical protein
MKIILKYGNKDYDSYDMENTKQHRHSAKENICMDVYKTQAQLVVRHDNRRVEFESILMRLLKEN